MNSTSTSRSLMNAGLFIARTLLIGICTQSTAQAAATSPFAPQPIAASALSPNVVSRLTSSTFLMNDSANDSFCSAFLVSHDGYALTAMHCVRNCLAQQNVLEQSANPYLGLNDIAVLTPKPGTVAPLATCTNLSIPALGITTGIEVLATGPAITVYNATFLSNSSGLFSELKNRGWTNKANDFALIKLPPSATTLKTTCLPLATSPTVPGQDLWSVGFPLPDNRANDPVLSSSYGKLYAQPEQSSNYASQISGKARAWVKEQFGTPGVLYSSSANTFGQSGGPVIDENGAVIGITSGFSNGIASANVPNGAEIHELVAGSTAYFLRSFPADIASALMTANSACK